MAQSATEAVDLSTTGGLVLAYATGRLPDRDLVQVTFRRSLDPAERLLAAGDVFIHAPGAHPAAPWPLISAGQLTVSTHGFYLLTPDGLHPWAWPSVLSMDVREQHLVHLIGQSVDGQVSWLLGSSIAELTFGLWALTMHPNHPQLHG